MSKIQPSDAETLKALYYKLADHCNYSECRDFEELIKKIRSAAR